MRTAVIYSPFYLHVVCVVHFVKLEVLKRF